MGIPLDGEKIRRLREKQRMTQAQLAVKSGIDPSTLRQIEKGRQTPHAATIQGLARALGVKPVVLASDRL